MFFTKPRIIFNKAWVLSFLLHGLILFFVFPKSQGIKEITAKLGFNPSRFTISSILNTKTKPKLAPSVKPIKKALPKESKTVDKTLPIEPSKDASQVKTFEESIIKNTPPNYPRIARKRGWQGDVELLIHVSSKGLVKNIDVLSSNAHQVLTKSAVESAKSWAFVPSQDQLDYKVRKVIKYQLK